jgi:hypothetical protein
LLFLYATRDRQLTFQASSSISSSITLSGYADATWVGKTGSDVLSRSTTGYVLMLCGGPVAWKSVVQKRPALSSTDAEFVAASEAAREAVCLRNLLEELGFPQRSPTVLEDNRGCEETVKNLAVGSGLKHVLLREHYVLWAAEERLIEVKRVASKDNVADLFTKPLPPSQHSLLSSKLITSAL